MKSITTALVTAICLTEIVSAQSNQIYKEHKSEDIIATDLNKHHPMEPNGVLVPLTHSFREQAKVDRSVALDTYFKSLITLINTADKVILHSLDYKNPIAHNFMDVVEKPNEVFLDLIVKDLYPISDSVQLPKEQKKEFLKEFIEQLSEEQIEKNAQSDYIPVYGIEIIKDEEPIYYGTLCPINKNFIIVIPDDTCHISTNSGMLDLLANIFPISDEDRKFLESDRFKNGNNPYTKALHNPKN
ncbi:hypothetical protein ACFPK9_15905 [Rubritalea spongiae]|uniref:DUF3160 domain-containing protein n=1 Tax=Rubritalea spongiae TaxID=430797 RepID=A0ABW5E1T0_9BACT